MLALECIAHGFFAAWLTISVTMGVSLIVGTDPVKAFAYGVAASGISLVGGAWNAMRTDRLVSQYRK